MRKIFLTAIVLPLFVAPVSAGTYGGPGVAATIAKAQSRQSMPIGGTARAARNAYGMEAPTLGLDGNSPEATGGGSLGYNRKLLQY